MDQNNAPLYEALRERRLSGETGFHVPGHKFGASLTEEERICFGSIMEIDYTEIEGLDDLHHPEGIIAEAQRLAAECFGAARSFFLVGGSTVGNLAVLGALCGRGEVMLVQRNAHKSVIHGLMLAGARAVFMEPETDAATGLAGCVALETVQEAIRRYPEAKGVFLTNPSYYGMGRDLGAYAAAAHEWGMPLLVDEAHGAHFGFHEQVPPSALSCGADAVIQSTHKMLSAMTMGAMLHVQGDLVDADRIAGWLGMLQSSSPSYPLMASLDLARRRVAQEGERLLGQALQGLDRLRGTLAPNSASAHLYEAELLLTAGQAYDYMDPFKLLLFDPLRKRTGFQLQRELAAAGIIAEMADERYVVLACSLATRQADLDRLEQVGRQLGTALLPSPAAKPDQKAGTTADKSVDSPPLITMTIQDTSAGFGKISLPVVMELEQAQPGTVELVPLREAIGRICAQSVIPYPPGIPLLFPGEQIGPEIIKRIESLALAGARFQDAGHEGAGCSIMEGIRVRAQDA